MYLYFFKNVVSVMPNQSSIVKLRPWGNSNGIIISKSILKAANLEVGDNLKIKTKKSNGKTIVELEPVTQTLSEKYAEYKGTPESYQQPNDLKDWDTIFTEQLKSFDYLERQPVFVESLPQDLLSQVLTNITQTI